MNAGTPPELMLIPLPKIAGEDKPPKPSAASHWVAGYWEWDVRWIWVPGHWTSKPHPAARWVAGQWQEFGANGLRWVAGHWLIKNPWIPERTAESMFDVLLTIVEEEIAL